MVVVDRIDIELNADLENYEKWLDEAELLARDTKQKLDRDTLIKLRVNAAELEVARDEARKTLRQVRAQFEEWLIPRKRLIEAQAELRKVSTETTEANARLRNYQNTWDETFSRFRRDLKEAADWVDGLSWAVGKLGTALAAAFAAIWGAGAVLEADKAFRKLQRSTNATAQEAEALGESLKDLSRAGFTDLDRNAKVLADINKEFWLIWDEATRLGRQSLAIADTFDKDVNEVLRAATGLYRNFWITGEEANDIITATLQKSWDQYDDILDTLNEYSVQFALAWFSAEEFAWTLVKGSQAWAFQIDKVWDAVKEATVSVLDGSKRTRDAFDKAGLSYDDFRKKLVSWEITIREWLTQINGQIENLDQGLKDEVWTAIYKTKWEDLWEAAILATTSAENWLEDVSWAAERLAEETELWLNAQWNIFKWELQAIALEAVPFLNKAFIGLRKATDLIILWIQIAWAAITEWVSNWRVKLKEISNRFSELSATIKWGLQSAIESAAASVLDWFDNTKRTAWNIRTLFKNLAQNIEDRLANAFTNIQIKFWNLANFIWNNPLTESLWLDFNLVDTDALKNKIRTVQKLTEDFNNEETTLYKDAAEERRQARIDELNALKNANKEELDNFKATEDRKNEIRRKAIKLAIIDTQERFKELDRTQIDIEKEGAKIREKNTQEENKKNLENYIKSLDEWTKEQKDQVDKRAENAKKAAAKETKDREKEYEKQKTAAEKTYRDIDRQIEASERTVDRYKTQIEQIGSAFEKAKSTALKAIKDIDDQIADIDKNKTQSIAERVLFAQERLKEISDRLQWNDFAEGEVQALLDEQEKLRRELEIWLKNVTDSDLTQAKENQELTPTEQILKEAEDRKNKLLEERAEIEANLELAREKADLDLKNIKDLKEAEEDLIETRKQLQKSLTEVLWEEAEKQIDQVKAVQEQIKQLIDLKKEAWLTTSNLTPSTVAGNTTTQNITQTNNVTINESSTPQATASAVTDAINEASRNNINGIN